MNVSLTPELEEFVHRKVESGRYNSASEVVREGLRLLDDNDRMREMRMDEMRREVMKGVEQLKNGEYLQLDSEEELKAFFEDIKRRGRKRLEANRK